MIYTGIDSAWGGRARGAVCHLLHQDGDNTVTLRETPARMYWPELARTVAEWGAEPRVVLIDQPLVVINRTGMRPVERDINAKLVAEYGCGAYPANLDNTTCFGPIAGIWSLLDALDAAGYAYDPAGMLSGEASRFYAEGYPHLSILGLFDLPRVVRYKVHKHEPEEWARLLRLLHSLTEREELRLEDGPGFLQSDLRQTKANEDLVDALICAYSAAWAHRRGTAGSSILGDAKTGAILTPVSNAMRTRLQALLPSGRMDGVQPGVVPVPRPEPGAPVGSSGDAPETASVQAIGGTDPSTKCPDGWTEADLVAIDSGCLWRRRSGAVVNGWFDRFEDVRLLIRFVEVKGQPAVELTPFARQGAVQRGMKPESEQGNRQVWSFLVDGCSRATPRTYRVCYRYEDL